jgi:PAS domain S-box-containing protein
LPVAQRYDVVAPQDGPHPLEERYWMLVSSPVVGDEGEVSFISHQVEDVTERVILELKRRESEENLRYTVELSTQVPWTANSQGGILDFSPKWLDLTGLTREEALGAGWMQVPHPDDQLRMVEAWTRSVKTGEPYDIEHRLRLRDGNFRWMRSRAFPRRGSAGEIVCWYGTTEDIDERTQAERKNAFLVQLDDAVRRLKDPQAITQTAARMLGAHLDVNRCAYADVEDDENTFNLTGDFNRGVPSIVGRYTFTQFGAECLRLMREGEAYVVSDSETDERTEVVVSPYPDSLGYLCLIAEARPVRCRDGGPSKYTSQLAAA